jgi:hypothetical protein
MSSLATPGPWLSSYESDALDKDEVLSPKVSAEYMADKGGEVLVYSSSADDPDLSNFVSVADLKRTLGTSSIDFSMFCLGAPAGDTGYKASSSARWPTPSPPPLPMPLPALGRPVRGLSCEHGGLCRLGSGD